MTAETSSSRPLTSDKPRKISATSIAIVAGVCKALDALVIVLGVDIAYRILALFHSNVLTEESRYILTSLIVAVVFVAIFEKAGGYTAKHLPATGTQFYRVSLIWLSIQCWGLLMIYPLHGHSGYSVEFLAVWALDSLVLLYILRFGLALFFRRWRQVGALQRKVVVIGAGETGSRIVQTLQDSPQHYAVLGIFDDRQDRVPPHLHGVPVLGTIQDLQTFARSELPDEIIVTLPIASSNRLSTVFRSLTMLPVDLRLTCETIAPGFRLRNVSYIGATPVLDIFHRPLKDWGGVYKWLEDKILSSIILLLLSPVLLVIALLIKLDSPGPVFFKQDRYGFNNRVIKVLKFRSMYVDRSDVTGAQQTVRGDRRVTRVGRVLRSFSLDELPQLINVLRGDMSLVGPRAHAVAMKIGEKLYNDTVDEYFARHRVRPGLTGLAQINGFRGEISGVESARKRVEHDLEYIDNWSIWLDLEIIVKSVVVVLFTRENAY
jgi:Undecaprenyl-phosphate glucose phosphotransferase